MVNSFNSFLSEQENTKAYDLLVISHDGIDDVNETGPLLVKTASDMGIKSFLAETMGEYKEYVSDGTIYYNIKVHDKPDNTVLVKMNGRYTQKIGSYNTSVDLS